MENMQKMIDIAISIPVAKKDIVSKGRKLSRKKLSIAPRFFRLSAINFVVSMTRF